MRNEDGQSEYLCPLKVALSLQLHLSAVCSSYFILYHSLVFAHPLFYLFAQCLHWIMSHLISDCLQLFFQPAFPPVLTLCSLASPPSLVASSISLVTVLHFLTASTFLLHTMFSGRCPAPSTQHSLIAPTLLYPHYICWLFYLPKFNSCFPTKRFVFLSIHS